MLLESLIALGTFAGYEVQSVDHAVPHPSLERASFEVQVGSAALDHFSIVNVGLRRADVVPRATVILLSPFTLPAEFYEISETGDYGQSFAGRLARSGFDVWLVDQRQTGLPAGGCEAGLADCSTMGAWNFQTYSTDALFALWLSRTSGHGARTIVGGFSAGSNAAIATVNRAPEEFTGLWLYEGTFLTHDPAIQAYNDANCTTLDGLIASGATYDPSVAVLGLVLQLAAVDPDGVSPLPFFPPGTSNQLAALLVFGAPPPPGAIAPTATFVRNIADFQSESFVYSNQDRLSLVGPLFDNYGSLAALRDLACGLAGHDTTYVDQLSAFRGDVLVFVEGTGFGPAMHDTAAVFTSASSVTLEENVDLGEADPYFHRDWTHVFYRPLHRWLDVMSGR